MPFQIAMIGHHFATHATSHAGSGLLDEFVHWMVRGAAWRVGSRIINITPISILIIGAIIALIAYFVIHRHKTE